MLGGFRTARVLAVAQGRNLVHLAQIGLAYGLIETVSAIGISLAPLLAGILYQEDPVYMYLVSLCLILAAILVSIYLTPRAPRSLPEQAVAINKL
jgi:MFS family permease